MANMIICRYVVRDAVGTKIRRNASNWATGRATLLLLLISLATEAATRPDGGHTSGAGDGHISSVYQKKDTSRFLGDLKHIGLNFESIDIDLLNNVALHRISKSILDFKFHELRKRWLTDNRVPPNGTKGIVYWMYRDKRVQDNWALLYAQQFAIQEKVPLHIVYCALSAKSKITLRQFKFLTIGLKNVENDLKQWNIPFHFLYGGVIDVLTDFVKNHNIGAIVVDFLPLRDYMNRTKELTRIFKSTVPVIMVDAHNVIPCWTRPKIIDKASPRVAKVQREFDKQVKEYLTEFPQVVAHPFKSRELIPQPIDWENTDKNFEIDLDALPSPLFKPGYNEGILELERFMKFKLENYTENMEDPLKNGLSNLSPWLNFGQISVQRVLLEVINFSNKFSMDVNHFKDQLLIRRELAENYCYYRLNVYDSIKGGRYWARITLNEHRNDTRPYVYTREEFEKARTHDDLWNAAQIQLVIEGKIHHFLRMYWAKKILEWTESPERALATAIYLNNKYSLDGNDPNSYVGCMWAICGVHDRPCKKVNRPIYGSLRYIDSDWYQKSFDTEAFIEKYKPFNYVKESVPVDMYHCKS